MKGLSACIAMAADWTLPIPMRASVWITWRWRFEFSTASSSTTPIDPTPDAAR